MTATGTLERRAEAKVWPMDGGGAMVKTDSVDTARRAYADWLTQIADAPYENDHSMNPEDIPGYVARCRYRAGWYRWDACNPRSCYDGTQHRPGHLSRRDGPAPGVWRGVLVDSP